VNGRGRRGRSIFAGVLLVLLGVLFLIDIYYPEVRLGHLIAVYWPVLLIVWGGAKIFDYLVSQHRGEPRPAPLTGGEAALIIVLVIVLGGFVIRDWVRQRVARVNFDVPEFGPSYSQSESLPPQTLPANSQLAIDLGRGDITVQGHDGDDLLIEAQKKVWGLNETTANRQMDEAQVRVENFGGMYQIRPVFGPGTRGQASVDLTLQAPSSASVAASTKHGDIRVANITGRAQAHTNNGDIDIQNAGGDVAADQQERVCRGIVWPPCGPGGDTHVANVHGNVRVTGRGGDVNVSDVSGNLSIEGGFAGTIHAQHVEGEIHCGLPWSQINVSQLNGTLEADLGDVKISNASGPVRIGTHNSDVSVNSVTGRVEIADAHADVKVTLSSPPTQDINITNDAGDVDVALPARSSFEVDAISRGGDVDSDFSGGQLNVSNTDTSGEIAGRVGAGGPKITIATTYGTIRLRKASSGR
jgi:DUF4097 and DUF4098 domain-containing protein YvlB